MLRRSPRAGGRRVMVWVGTVAVVLPLVATGNARADTGGGFVTLGSSFDTGVLSPSAALATGDLNHDGRSDIVTDGFPHMNVLLMQPDGTLQPDTAAPPLAPGYSDAAIGQLTTDDNPDLVVVGGAHTVAVFAGDGTGGFTMVSTIDYPDLFSDSLDLHVAVGDVNGDGIDDVAVSSYDDSAVDVLLNDGTGHLTLSPQSPIVMPGRYVADVGLADINGDSIADLVAVSVCRDPIDECDTGAVSVMLGTGPGAFAPAPGSPYDTGLYRPTTLGIGDVNGDGHLDVVVGNDFAVSRSLSVMLGGPLGLEVAPGSPTPFDPTGGGPLSIGFDRNLGQSFIAVPETYGTALEVMLADPSGRLAPASGSPYPIAGYPGYPSYAVVADAVGDLYGTPYIAIQSVRSGSGNQMSPLSVVADELIPQVTVGLAATADPVTPGKRTTLSARVRHADGRGRVVFAKDGIPIAHCGGSRGVRMHRSVAKCTLRLHQTGSHTVVAKYRPTASSDAISSTVLGETVARCGGTLRSCDLRHADLRNAQLANADLRRANLRGANLSHAILTGAILAHADLRGANLNHAVLIDADLGSANAAGSNLSAADLYRAALPKARLAGARLVADNLTDANLRHAKARRAKLTGALWAQTICPDGSRSQAHGRTCQGHL